MKAIHGLYYYVFGCLTLLGLGGGGGGGMMAPLSFFFEYLFKYQQYDNEISELSYIFIWKNLAKIFFF